jgi:hypothetical protein
MKNNIFFPWLSSCYLTYLLKILSILLNGKSYIDLKTQLKAFNRFIEINWQKVKFANYFNQYKASNYLGLQGQYVYPENINKFNYIFPLEKCQNIKKNNADVLILSDLLLWRLWFFNDYKHTQYILYTPTNLLALIVGIPGLFKNLFLKRIKIIGLSFLEDDLGVNRPTLIVKVLKRVIPNARRYISPVVGIENFFKKLAEKKINYTILRWFEDLPKIMPGEDIDMLVADEDIEILESILQEHPGIIPCDIYTVSGLPGTAYKNMAYYPPLLAEQILKGSIILKQYFRVPNQEIYFYSLAYHAIYHKGKKSGLPISLAVNNISELDNQPEHEYTQILDSLAKSLKIDVAITLEDLDKFLDSISWRPSLDTLARLEQNDFWLKEKHRASLLADEKINLEGLVVFFIRQKALDFQLENNIIDLIISEGFNLIEKRYLTPEEVERVKYQIRGGNWGKGPWPESGGDPAMVLIAIDLMPLPPTTIELEKQPHLSNGRIAIKNQIRDEINKLLPVKKQCNTIHSSDNEQEAWNYLQIALPEKCADIQEKIRKLRDNFLTTYPVKQELTRFGRRAKVEVIEYQGKLAVKKTFRSGCEHFFERELFVCKSFSEKCSAIPSLIDYGSSYLINPYYEDILLFQNRQSKLLPLSVAKQAIATLNFFYEQGYALIDFQPANIIGDRKTGFKLIDFEFLYQYKNQPNSLEECYELAGIPDDFDGDKPDFRLKMSYETRWKPYVGLSLKSLLYDPIWLQHIKRFCYGTTHLPIRLLKNRLNALLSHYDLTIDRVITERKKSKKINKINK